MNLVTDLHVQPRSSNNSLVKLQSPQRLVTPSVPSVSVVTKRSPATLPLEVQRLRKSSNVVLRSRNTNSRRATSLKLVTLVSVLTSTSIWVSSTTQVLVSSVLTSTSSCPAQDTVLLSANHVPTRLASNTRSRRRKHKLGSDNVLMVSSYLSKIFTENLTIFIRYYLRQVRRLIM